MEEQVCRQIEQILAEELLPAMGCTEPVSIAYAAAKARELLGREPERLLVEVSGNIRRSPGHPGRGSRRRPHWGSGG